MRADVVAVYDDEPAGTTIEVVGFVSNGGQTWAVWRDDYGMLSEIPTWAIRMLPRVDKPETYDDLPKYFDAMLRER